MPMIIGALIAALMGALREYLPTLFGRVLLAFGIGLFTHQVAMPALLGMIQARVSGLPSVLLAYFGALGIDVCITIILSAAAAKAAQKVFVGKLGNG